VSNWAPELYSSVLDPESDGVVWLKAIHEVPIPEPPEQLDVSHEPVLVALWALAKTTAFAGGAG
jgi:hypothetical protein